MIPSDSYKLAPPMPSAATNSGIRDNHHRGLVACLRTNIHDGNGLQLANLS